jgi:hypothetical protein
MSNINGKSKDYPRIGSYNLEYKPKSKYQFFGKWYHDIFF